MAVTTAGHAGPDVRGDVRVTVEDGAGIQIESTVHALYGAQISDQVAQIMGVFGNPGVRVRLEDSGALPFVLAARLECAICAHLGFDLPPLPLAHREPKDRPWRTRLYVAGDVPKQMPNASLYGADCVILDPEDAVAPASKLGARALVRRALHHLDWSRTRVAVRINAGPPGGEDLIELAPQAPDAVFIPKAESPEEIATLSALVRPETAVVPILETAAGVLRAFEIAKSSPRVAAVAIGLQDYLADLGGTDGTWAMGFVANAARAAGVVPLASVYPSIDDIDGLRQYARQAAAMGFEGIGCIHPAQVGPANEAFAPTPEEVSEAEAIVAAFESAGSEDRGALAWQGRMIDAPVVRRARTVLLRAEALR